MLNYTTRNKKRKIVMGRERKKKIPECLIYDLNIK